jgi:hypothetical protein
VGKKIQIVETQNLIVYKISSPVIDILKGKNFVIPILAEVILASVLLNNVLPYLVWVILVVFTIPILIQVLQRRNVIKIELDTKTRELCYKDKNEKSERKFIPDNAKVIHTINTENVTYLYPDEKFARGEVQYIANLEIADALGSVKFQIYLMSKNRSDIHWVGQMSRNLAKELNLVTGGIKETTERKETVPYPRRYHRIG